ncbi:UDP-N-acetylmuramate dehydrogenase [Candidatus Sumerlaeota bacterium]|nr:UDP-N-acetylmuramate dehydrogenase [Candidatus Sumerlaeota bacterium]
MTNLAPPEIPGIEIRQDVPVGKFTSISIDCRAKALVVADSDEGLGEFLRWAHANDVPWHMLGGGTNCFFADDYYDGYVIKLGQAFRDIKIHGHLIRVGCALPLSRLLNIAVAENLTGIEFLWDIPGTVGGAVTGNSGSANQSIGSFVEAVRGYTPAGERFACKKGGYEFEYRNSALRGMVVTEAVLRLVHDSPEAIEERLAHYKKLRQIQPAGVKSSGCVFKNPPDHSAGQLIDECGLKGTTVGGAMVSTDHANYIVNKNKATAQDILELIMQVQQTVKEQKDIDLSVEVQIIQSPR